MGTSLSPLGPLCCLYLPGAYSGHPVTGHSALWGTPRLGPLLPWSHAGTCLDILGSPLCPNTVAGTDTPSPHAVCTRWIKEENTDIYSGGAKYPPNPPQKCPHPGASPPDSPDTCAQDGGGQSCPILGRLGPCASVSPSVTGLPWDGGTWRTLGEEEPLWPPHGDKDVATSPREHGMKLEAPGIEARASHLPPHPRHRHSYPFIPKFVTLLSPSPGRGGRSRCDHPTSLCGRRGGGWGELLQLESLQLSCAW